MTSRARALRLVFAGVPAAAFAVHVTLIAHILGVVGHWPRQYTDPEIAQLGSAALILHELAASVAILALPAAGLGLLVWGARSSRPTRREIALFAVPILVWATIVTLSAHVSALYGWLWD